MKVGSSSSVKLSGLKFIFLVVTIITVWLVSSNILFFKAKINDIVDRVFPKLGVYEQTSLTKLSEIDDYVKGFVAGTTSPNKFPNIDVQVKQKNILIL